ncbi:hypothetical protein SLE2022_123170 [Rubroshorea leprosula]
METQNEKKSSAVSDVGAWAMNVISSVRIIMANKQLMSSAGYAFTFDMCPHAQLCWFLPHLKVQHDPSRVGICTLTDVKVNDKGFICACAAVLSTSLQQITIGPLQKKHSIGSFELLTIRRPPVPLLIFYTSLMLWPCSAMSTSASALDDFLRHHSSLTVTEEEIRLLKEGLKNIPIKDVELGESRV